jgi:hypothetical protein
MIHRGQYKCYYPTIKSISGFLIQNNCAIQNYQLIVYIFHMLDILPDQLILRHDHEGNN